MTPGLIRNLLTAGGNSDLPHDPQFGPRGQPSSGFGSLAADRHGDWGYVLGADASPHCSRKILLPRVELVCMLT